MTIVDTVAIGTQSTSNQSTEVGRFAQKKSSLSFGQRKDFSFEYQMLVGIDESSFEVVVTSTNQKRE